MRDAEYGVRKVLPGPMVRWKGYLWMWREEPHNLTLPGDEDLEIHGPALVGRRVNLYRITTPYTRYQYTPQPDGASDYTLISDWSRTMTLHVNRVEGLNHMSRVCGFFLREDMCLTEGL